MSAGGQAGRRLIIETDGGARGNPGPAGWGAVIRDADGTVLAERADYLGVTTNNVAEYSGLVAGLRTAKAIDPAARVEVRADSKLLVEQMSGRWQIKHESMRRLAAQARAAFPPEQVRYTWIPRSENAAADALANEAMDLRIAVVRDRDPSLADAGGSDPGEPDREGDEPGSGSWTASGAAMSPVDDEVEPAAGTSSEWVRSASGTGSRPGGGIQTAPLVPPALGSALHMGVGDPVTIVLVRHGQTDMTAARVYAGGGAPGVGLNAKGRTEAARAADLVNRIGREVWPDLPVPSVLLSSSMLRAQQTAAAIGRRLGVRARTDDAFEELRFGAWEGLTAPEIEARWPGQLRRWHRDPAMRALGGESMRDVAVRAHGAITRLLDDYAGKTVVVATHTITIRAGVGSVAGLDPGSWPTLRVPPASLSILRLWPAGHELTVLGCPSDL